MLQILIVDDDKNIRRYLAAVLTEAGYSVSCAYCAQKALEIMENEKIDLIVLDIMMPGMDGYDFARLLRDCNNDIPILMLSAKQLPEDIKEQTATLLIAGNLCKVKPRLLGSRINVMLSGSFEGYRSRKDFITKMNELYGDVVQLVDVGKRKTNVDFLVKENYTSDHEKSAIAAAAGIPILSPSIMEEKLGAYYAYINNRRDAT